VSHGVPKQPRGRDGAAPQDPLRKPRHHLPPKPPFPLVQTELSVLRSR
jgi:hypothetical protein